MAQEQVIADGDEDFVPLADGVELVDTDAGQFILPVEAEHAHEYSRRARTPYEQRVDFAQAKKVLDASEEPIRERLMSQLKVVQDGTIKDIEAHPNFDSDYVRNYTVQPDAQRTLQDMFETAWNDGRDAGSKELPVRERKNPAVVDVRTFAWDFCPAWAEFAEWDESKHKRRPRGDESGGEFAPGAGPEHYHGTLAKHIDSILSNGLEPGHQKNFSVSKDKIYMANNFAMALEYAVEPEAERTGNPRPKAIFRVRPDPRTVKLDPHPEMKRRRKWGSVASMTTKIPPEYITAYATEKPGVAWDDRTSPENWNWFDAKTRKPVDWETVRKKYSEDGVYYAPTDVGDVAEFAWDESKHPRSPKGTEKGGEFAPKEGEGHTSVAILGDILISHAEEAAIEAWQTENGFRSINSYLRTGKTTDPLAEKTSKALEGLVRRAKLPRQMKLYRGVYEDVAGQFAKLKVADVFRDDSFVAASRSKEESFPGYFHFVINAKRGQPALMLHAEKETILPPKTKFKVTRISKGKWTMGEFTRYEVDII